MQAFFLNFTLDGCQKPFNFNKLEGKKKNPKIHKSEAGSLDYFDTFPTSGWHDVKCLGKVFVPFYGTVQGSEP